MITKQKEFIFGKKTLNLKIKNCENVFKKKSTFNKMIFLTEIKS